MTRSAGPEVTGVDVAVFLAELAMLAVLAVAGAQLGSGTPQRIALATALPVVAAAVWGVWLAPRAGRRLSRNPGLAVKLAIFTVAAVLLAGSGSIGWAVAFWVVTVPLLVLAERSHARAD